MKDQAIAIASAAADDRAARNRLREYLQHVLLRTMFERDMLEDLVFHGGTALRILHDLPRFSEDLDFHTRTLGSGYNLGPYLQDLSRDLEQSGYRVELTPALEGNVQSCMVKFVGLLHECGLSPRAEARLNVKLEIDRRPPGGFGVRSHPVSVYFPFVVHHHDKPSFMAGKLHAILQRPYPKGRDPYDLMFYLLRWEGTEPNIEYLRQALDQTGYSGEPISKDNWRRIAADRLRALPWDRIREDVAPFLLRAADSKVFQQELLLQLLQE